MQRYSAKREAIINCLNMTDSHPTAEWIYNKVQKKYPSMSFATVYRNLKQMKQEGIINSVGFVDNHERFDSHLEKHSHFVCEKCHKVIDIDDDSLCSISTVKSLSKYQVNNVSICFYGLCEKCRKKDRN